MTLSDTPEKSCKMFASPISSRDIFVEFQSIFSADSFMEGTCTHVTGVHGQFGSLSPCSSPPKVS